MRVGLFSSMALVALLAACGGPSGPVVPPPRGPLGPPRLVPGSLEARPLLGETPSRASLLGAGPLTIVASGPMNEGERMGAFVEVPPDACLLAYGRASASLEDIDIAAFSAEGTPVAVDEGPDPKPTVLVCPPHPDRVYMALHAASGNGLAAIGAQLVPRDRAAEVGRAVAARGAASGATRSPEAWPGLDEQVRAHRIAIGGTWEELRRVAVAVDSRAVSAVALPIEEGGCTDVLVVPDEEVALVDVDVLDSEGRLVARAKESGAARSVTICSPIAVAGSLHVRPHIGRGLVAVVLGKAKPDAVRSLASRPEVAWVVPAQPLETTRAAKNAALAKAGYPGPTLSREGQLQLTRRATVPIELSTPGCTRIDVVAGAPLAMVDAAVWDDGGQLLASNDGPDGTTLFACGKGKARVDLGTRGRPGPYALLTRPEKWKDPAFAAHPLAAGRMLGRSAAGQLALHEGTGSAVRHAVLEASKQFVYNASVAPSSCLRIAIGTEGEGTGLEARVIDAVSGDELDRAHGQNGATLRACAEQATRTVRVEAHATTGKLDAVIGERTTPSK